MNHTKTTLKKIFLATIGVTLVLLLLFRLTDILFPLDKDRLTKPHSISIYDRNHHLLRLKLSSDGFWRFQAKTDEIPKRLKQSVIVFEDKYFYHHFGVNPFSILRALFHNLTHKHIIGASTLTMQVSRMMYQRERTLSNKLIEIFNALQLEYHYSKDEILRYYFNLAPYGGNIEGVKSAAMFYFQKPLRELSISQIALLTAIPKNPNANRPTKQKNLSLYRDKILVKLLKHRVITKEQYTRAKSESIAVKLLHTPFHAPHFTNQIKSNAQEINTTLDLSLQRFTLSRLRQQIKHLEAYDVHNSAAIIIENMTMQILAYVGSSDFFNTHNQGQNNGITMIRTPGSTLKPFIYARAFDSGFITPNQQLYDTDLFLQGYAPKNFNKHFTGRISAKEALQYSLNIPAVSLNHLLKEKSLYELLKLANIRSIDHPKAYYGDAIALGGCGISLMDLSLLYTALANGGLKKNASYTFETKQTKKIRLFSKESTYLVSDILADATRTTLSNYWESTQNMPKVAFKTGTSASAKDLLTIGYTPKYTVGVWFGNFDGHKTKDLTGLKSASQVVLDIFEHLNQQKRLLWFRKPKKIITQKRCVDAIIQKECQTKIYDQLIKGITPSLPCELIRPEIIAFLIKSRQITSLDELQTNRCYPTWKAYNPIITTPANKATITQNHLLPKELNKLKFNCYSFEQNQTIYWLIDTQKQIKTTSGKPLYLYLPEGKHEIGCLDQSAKLTIHKLDILH